MDKLLRLFAAYTGHDAQTVDSIKSSGSHRHYYRLSADGSSLIGVVGTDTDEDKAFIVESRLFRASGINVPEVLAVSEDGLAYLQEDLGDDLLFDRVAPGRNSGHYSQEECELLCKAMAGLPKIQYEGVRGLDLNICYPDREFNGRMVDFDLSYFKYCYLKVSSVEFNELRLQDDFDRLKADLLREKSETFMYRDFQARNVMIKDGEMWYIDFQGGRKGPIYYDVASFVWQAKSRFPQELKDRMIDAYLAALKPYNDICRGEFMRRLRIFVLFRTLQVLGAYGFRGRIEKRPHFLSSIPYALENVRELVAEPFEEYPYLTEVLRKISGTEDKVRLHSDTLRVDVMSFSYRKGLPHDASGNGGGYIFDCRGMHNPGRYEEYKSLTGMDREVIRFLESRGEVSAFLENIYGIVDPHVERYIQRGFDHLQICFGCTGGQHRSVYCAEAMARHLHEKYDIKVVLTHREREIEKEF
ncbi:MAG: phosphotransferase [Bacteroidales bacterium]|nr:phosphotransferase [Candidatus Cryptobacteroides onthequi]